MENISKPGTRRASARRIVAASALAAAAVVALAMTLTASAKNAAPAAAKAGVPAEAFDIRKLCGTKPISVALADGFGGNSWRKITRAEFENEAAKCKNLKVSYTDGQNNPQKAIADINGLVANGVNVLVLFPDAGPALLPALAAATKAGVKVVPEDGTPCAATMKCPDGKYFAAIAKEDILDEGKTQAKWMVGALHGKGNVLFLGGTPGNSYSATVFAGIQAVLAANPGVKLLENKVIDTNWDPANVQKVVAGLLAKYPKIDGILADYGGGSVGGIRAFVAANRKLIPWVANDENEFSCLWYKYKGTNPNFQIATVSSRNWMSRNALRLGLSALNGVADPEAHTVKLTLSEDSIAGGAVAPKCVSSLPPDAILSSHLTVAQLKALFK